MSTEKAFCRECAVWWAATFRNHRRRLNCPACGEKLLHGDAPPAPEQIRPGVIAMWTDPREAR